MASNIFNQADGTTLASIDSKWAGTPGSASVQSSVLRVSGNPYVDVNVWYVDGQGGSQQSELLLAPGVIPLVTGEYLSAFTQALSSSVHYELRLASANLGLFRSGVFQTAGAHGMNLANSGNVIKLTSDSATGVVNGYANGALICTITDATPLTGGYEGFDLYAGGVVNNVGILSWTNNAAVPVAAAVQRIVMFG